MTAAEKREELENLADKLGIKVVYGKIPGFSGDKCMYRGKDYIVINRFIKDSLKVSLLARFLSGFNLDEHYILPAVRDLIEKAREGDAPDS